jgi:flagellar protein FliO/FliZ
VQSIFGIQLSQPLVYIAALAIILVLLAIFAWVLRKISGAANGTERSLRGRQPRLGIVDTFSVDRQRQLVIVRRDSVEHLLLLGGTNDIVVESNIVRTTPNQTAQREVPAPARNAPTVTSFGTARPQPQPPSPPSSELSFTPEPAPATEPPLPSVKAFDFTTLPPATQVPNLSEIASRFENASSVRNMFEARPPVVSLTQVQSATPSVQPFQAPSLNEPESVTVAEPHIEPAPSDSRETVSAAPAPSPVPPVPSPPPLSASRDINSLNDTLRQLLGRTREP